MDLTQSKLTRAEWDSIEIAVQDDEMEVLNLIIDGYSDLNIRRNKTISMFSFLKIDQTPENEWFLYQKYFEPIVSKTIKKYGDAIPLSSFRSIASGPIKKMKSIDNLRILNNDSNIEKNKKIVYEFIVLEFCHELCRYITKNNNKYAYYLYTLIQLKKSNIQHMNTYVSKYMEQIIQYANEKTDILDIIERAYVFIEQNPYILEYEDRTLFPHQKELFSLFRPTHVTPKLVLYIAPTGTGKTLSPLGLSKQYRIIFVCVARHIGLALAKSAISMDKKIAFAFGCETASDIRLHYFAAVDYTRDRRSGGIRKVDNSNGSKVEIMICDVKSYLSAMHYMLAFNSETQIITYWDEPTITMDYENHDLHRVIHQNWIQNKIPHVVLSCATLPKEHEILDTLADFREKFECAEIHTITSYDCKKSIPIITKDGYAALPHFMYEKYEDLIECVGFCEENKTLLRYFDLQEIIKFAFYMNDTKNIDPKYEIRSYFTSIDQITMNSLKLYYLELLKHVNPESWNLIYKYMKTTQKSKFITNALKKSQSMEKTNTDTNKTFHRTTSVSQITENSVKPTATSSGVLITTTDAYTLTDGPTIFLTEDVSKIGNFYIQQSSIPQDIFQNVLHKISKNNDFSEKIAKLENALEDLENVKSKCSSTDDTKRKGTGEKKIKDMDKNSPEIQKLYKEIELLRREIKYVAMDPLYVPNTKQHQEKWTGDFNEKAFVPKIDETSVTEIMGLNIDNYLKVLLLLGIGLFMEGANPKYLEIIKTLAQNQFLYMIIASSDYVYGTNYQFCHGFLGKDMSNMTQSKTIQSLGRIGRNKIQQTYSVRFRDDTMLMNLFRNPLENREAINMSKLFCS